MREANNLSLNPMISETLIDAPVDETSYYEQQYESKMKRRECEQCHNVLFIKGNNTKCVDCRGQRMKLNVTREYATNITGNPEEPR